MSSDVWKFLTVAVITGGACYAVHEVVSNGYSASGEYNGVKASLSKPDRTLKIEDSSTPENNKS